jgi:hypothetical protein
VIGSPRSARPGPPRVAWGALAVLLAAALAASARPAAGQEAARAPGDAPAAAPSAASLALTMEVEPKEIHVGDPIKIRLRLTRPPGSTASLPALSGTLGDFEILSAGEPRETRAADGGTILEVEATATAWRIGDLSIPPVAASGGAPGEIQSEPVPVRVTSVGIEESKEIRPIKDPLTLPRDWKPILLAAAAAILAGLLAYAVWRRLRRKPAVLPAAPADTRPAHEIALAELERLAAQGLVERGRFVEHYVRLTEILRSYFEARYGIPALDMTTHEILEGLRGPLDRSGIRRSIEAHGAIASLLEDADLVKFAEFTPERGDALASIDRASRVVIATREEEAPPLAAAS